LVTKNKIIIDQGNNDEKNEQDDHVFSFPDGPDDHSNEKQLQ